MIYEQLKTVTGLTLWDKVFMLHVIKAPGRSSLSSESLFPEAAHTINGSTGLHDKCVTLTQDVNTMSMQKRRFVNAYQGYLLSVVNSCTIDLLSTL